MARQSIFSAPTRLWHPSQGWFTFGIGEQDPGAAWSETEGGNPAGAATATQALQDMIELQEQVEQRDRALAAKDHDLAQAARAREDAESQLEGLKNTVAETERQRDEHKENLQGVMSERDQLAGVEADLRAKLATAEIERDEAKARVTELETDIANANQRASDAEAALAAFDGDKDGKPGGRSKRAADTQPAPTGE